jgi:hypothetical protein
MTRMGLSILFLLAACRTEPFDTSSPVDASPAVDGSNTSLGPLAHCSGDAPFLSVNGQTVTSPAVTAKPLYLDCCNAAAFEIDSQQLAADAVPLVFSWIAPAGAQTQGTVDLAHAPNGWRQLELASGCPADTTFHCKKTDTWTSGLDGTLNVESTGGQATRMSVCLATEDASSSTHPVLKQVRLYVPPMQIE